MQVILRQNVDNLGRTGEVVTVSDGYARNYLLPQGLVSVAKPGNVAELEHHRRILEKKRLAERASVEEIAKKLGKEKFTFERKVGRNDRLFGSVSGSDLLSAIKKAGFGVEKKDIQLKEPLKKLGEHSVEIRFDSELSTSIKVEITKKED
jgi:large subunit ribosomal protein L9